jgi:hypothetical protein
MLSFLLASPGGLLSKYALRDGASSARPSAIRETRNYSKKLLHSQSLAPVAAGCSGA